MIHQPSFLNSDEEPFVWAGAVKRAAPKRLGTVQGETSQSEANP